MSLKEYRRKRKFQNTPEPEPAPKPKRGKGPLRFVIQKHAASRTHYDFRLELDGALKSWAVPRGPSLTGHDPRLAVRVEDHPLEYGEFEGVIPKGNYGAGTVMIWDAGTYVERGSTGREDSEAALQRGLAEGHITFILHGTKLRGEFALVKTKNKKAEENSWLLLKKRDEFSTRQDVLKQDRSSVSDRSMEQIAAQAERDGDVWLPKKGRQEKPKTIKKPIATAKTKPAPAPTALTVKKPPSSEMPHRVRPMEPVFATAAPKGEGWIYEAFGSGIRAIAEVEPGRVRLYSRTLLNFEKKHPDILTALKKLKGTAVLDGEIVREGDSAKFVLGDLLYRDGKDLRPLSLTDRKKQLAKLKLPEPLQLAVSATDPAQVSLASKLTKVVAKRAEAPYHSGVSRDWIRFRPRTTKAGTTRTQVSDTPPLTNLDKLYFPEAGYTKGDLLKYYDSVSSLILPYLIDRPQSLHRQPDGLRNEGFFHKDMNSYLPRQIQTERIYSGSSQKTINYALCQDRWSLLYLVNQGCIELNPWLSRRGSLDYPDLVVIDLDPDGNPFEQVIEVALEVNRVLKAVGAQSWCKTSGSSGMHICIPTGAKFDFDTGRLFAEAVCRIVHQRLPKFTSVERNPAKRRRKIYLDFLQNRRAQTLAAPYCVRPRAKATVSTPLKWSEVKKGLTPEAFTIETMAARIKKVGDLWKPMLTEKVDIEACARRLSKIFHNGSTGSD